VNMPEATVPEVRDADVLAVLDEESSRLPDRYRGVIVLCDLEGMTRREAARQLGIPEGSVASRLARARALLAKRLARRGVAFSGSSVAALLSAGVAGSAPPALVASTIKAASLLAAGQAAGIVSAKVAALTEGVVKAMFVTKIKSVLAVVLVVGLALPCTAGLIYQTQAADKPNAKDKKGEKGQPVTKEEQPAKKEIAGLAKEVVKVKIERLLSEKQEKSEAKTEIDDKEKIAKVLAFFPETGTGKRPDRSLPRPKKGDGASYFITLYPTKTDQEPLRYIMVSPDREMWGWSEGGPPVNDDWNLNKPKEVGKFLDDLLAGKRQAQEEKKGNKEAEKPPHVVEKPDKKAGVDTFAHGPTKVVGEPTEDSLSAESKLFMSRMPSGHGDVRFRDFFDPRYLKKHGLTGRDIAFEVIDNWPSFRGIHSIVVADDNRTVLCILDTKDGKELFVLRWVVYEGHIYISPEKAPDPKTGIFKPWILRKKVK
jgi:hypothetical protein